MRSSILGTKSGSHEFVRSFGGMKDVPFPWLAKILPRFVSNCKGEGVIRINGIAKKYAEKGVQAVWATDFISFSEGESAEEERVSGGRRDQKVNIRTHSCRTARRHKYRRGPYHARTSTSSSL